MEGNYEKNKMQNVYMEGKQLSYCLLSMIRTCAHFATNGQ